MKYILGSASKSRKKVLEQAGFDFEVFSADIDEKSIRDANPSILTQKLAKAKVDALKHMFSDAIILTADTVVWCDGAIYEKPTSAEEFLNNYTLFQEKPLKLVTGFAVTSTAEQWQEIGVDEVDITYSSIPFDVLNAVVAKNTFDSFAGGVEIEEPLLKPYLTMVGDYGTAMGLPVLAIQNILRTYK